MHKSMALSREVLISEDHLGIRSVLSTTSGHISDPSPIPKTELW